jgi:hypothetical protein
VGSGSASLCFLFSSNRHGKGIASSNCIASASHQLVWNVYQPRVPNLIFGAILQQLQGTKHSTDVANSVLGKGGSYLAQCEIATPSKKTQDEKIAK